MAALTLADRLVLKLPQFWRRARDSKGLGAENRERPKIALALTPDHFYTILMFLL